MLVDENVFIRILVKEAESRNGTIEELKKKLPPREFQKFLNCDPTLSLKSLFIIIKELEYEIEIST